MESLLNIIIYVVIFAIWLGAQRRKAEPPPEEENREEIDVFAKYPPKPRPETIGKKDKYLAYKAAKKAVALQPAAKAAVQPPLPKPAELLTEEEKPLFFSEEDLKTENLRKGIIYSIILGPPRSRRKPRQY